MPTWLRKRLTTLKEEFFNLGNKHKSRTNTVPKRKRHTTERSTHNEPSIRMIHNHLTTTTRRIRDKSETNAYRDYAKWRDGVVINQNNYASYRCACVEAAPAPPPPSTTTSNSCSVDNETLSSTTGIVCDKKQAAKCCRTVNELVSSRRLDCDERCDSESELIAHFFFSLSFPCSPL